MAVGLDCGTSFYISAREKSIKKQRNAFLTVDGDAEQSKRMLKRQRIPFVEKAGKVHIVGKHAFNYAQIFSTATLRRPMKDGLLNPTEKDSLPILNAIIGELLGKSKKEEVCVYCIPSKPIDVEREVSYHDDVLSTIIESYGYKAHKVEEAVALGYEGLVDNELTGVSISMVMQDIYGESTEEFTVMHALRSYYGALVNYLLVNLKAQFEGAANVPNFPKPVPIVIGGGTSLVKGFIEVFNEQFDPETFPLEVSEIILIEDAHTAVSRGCLSEAQLTEEDEAQDNT